MAKPAIGMMTYSFGRSIREGCMSLPDAIRLCATLGVEAIDLAEAHLGDPQADISAFLAALSDTGLPVASSHTGLDLITRGEAARGEREQEARRIFERLGKLDCGHVMLGSPTGDLSAEDWRREYGIGLGECAPIAADYGITVTFENRGGPAGLLVGTADHCEEILGHAGDTGVRFTFDVGNFRYVGADHNAAFERLAQYTAHVHLKDVVPRGESFGMVPLGEGEVDNAPIIRKLAASGFGGCLAIECGGLGTDEDDARKSVEFVQNVRNEG
ncbi:MAG: sugar phosphate isomerase/epimerase [Lentisphaerae bacterium]|nr:sugar phosphate isomerase/epimerase [Lentisphaerota bacterium]MBT4818787.1 sugar phosphate isomerase/epimerase [Lentisphaerota bacterium]MBT5608396.1 sugar phosphate isomerase/epimerase [Lentisphaerota bacterium]MBT7054984.1 sugar phosphate isomerase/epimerase [Lentisphaerota bacterium]MBT7844819.1 sugar phosphate isomerase/epimerase [Lentisphaerota bacterium]